MTPLTIRTALADDVASMGFAMLDAPSRSIWALFVSPEAERQGVGRALQAVMLEAAFAVWPRVSLSTSPGTRAESFYLVSGWIPSGTRGNGELGFELARDTWLSQASAPGATPGGDGDV